MSLVSNKEVVKYFKENDVKPKVNCKCISDASIKYCNKNCTNTSFHKINYS